MDSSDRGSVDSTRKGKRKLKKGNGTEFVEAKEGRSGREISFKKGRGRYMQGVILR